MPERTFQLVPLPNGAFSVHDHAYGETCHPIVGPVAEAQALYVEQTRLAQRLQAHPQPLVVWDVGLGCAANALTVLNAAQGGQRNIHLVSFDESLAPLRFALAHPGQLPYLAGWEAGLQQLIHEHQARFSLGTATVQWRFHAGHFPDLIHPTGIPRHFTELPAPDLILYDPFSPATNPAMWTLPLFSAIHLRLDPARPCLLPTYSRSTLLRVTLLLAGFYVGHGQPCGAKEETSLAASHPSLIEHPLDHRWLQRALRSHSAEPLSDPVYHQKPLSPESRRRLLAHPQFQ